MHLWAHRAIQLGIVPVIVTIAMSVESRVLGPQPVPPPARAGEPAAPVVHHPSKAPGARKTSVSPGRTSDPGLRLTANQAPSPTSRPGAKPTPPADHHGSSPGGGGAPAPTPTVTPTRTALSPPTVLPTPSPAGTCVVQVLNISVVCTKS